MVRLMTLLGILTSSLLGQTSVPFVGCKSGGQLGSGAAPKGVEKVVSIDAIATQGLAFYKDANTSGVLAPRGWHCFAEYGSSGSTLFVTPRPIKTDEVFSTKWTGLSGPAIELHEIVGDTAGRFQVARFITRVFPAHLEFARGVIREGVLPASEFPSGPYPQDRLIYQGDSDVEYHTPPHLKGLGTMGSLLPDADPIDGFAMLRNRPPDLLVLAVRLPPSLIRFAPEIVQQTKRDNSAGSPKR